MAIRFDATADLLSRTADLLSFNAAYTWMGWVYLVSDINVAGIIWSSNNAAGSEIDGFLVDNDGTTLANYVNGTGVNSGTLTAGTWVHLCIRRTTNSNLDALVNGAGASSNTTATSGTRTQNAMYVGSFGGAGSRADVRVAGMKLWSVALSDAEIANEMRTLRPQRTANLYGFYPGHHSTAANSALDFSGNGRNWTVGGTLTIEDGPPVPWGGEPIFPDSPTSAGHATSGALAADAATVAGTAAHFTLHPTSGALASQAATVAGTAAHLTLHTSTGALVAQSATVAGTADSPHLSSGALAAQAATAAGTAVHLTLHTSTGALAAQSATVAGTAADEHASTGALVAAAATVAGDAVHTVPDIDHDASGALAAAAAVVAGTATHLTLHTTSGALAAQAATLAGTAAAEFAASGALAAQAATVAGTAEHTAPGVHDATGDLLAGDAQVAGAAELISVAIVSLGGRDKTRLWRTHTFAAMQSKGALGAGSASIAGQASRTPGRVSSSFGARIRAAADFKPPLVARPQPAPSPAQIEAPAPSRYVTTDDGMVRTRAAVKPPETDMQRIARLERQVRDLQRKLSPRPKGRP